MLLVDFLITGVQEVIKSCDSREE